MLTVEGETTVNAGRLAEGLPGLVDGVGGARLPALLSADVLGGLHHFLCGLVILQGPLVQGHLAVLQNAHLDV